MKTTKKLENIYLPVRVPLRFLRALRVLVFKWSCGLALALAALPLPAQEPAPKTPPPAPSSPRPADPSADLSADPSAEAQKGAKAEAPKGAEVEAPKGAEAEAPNGAVSGERIRSLLLRLEAPHSYDERAEAHEALAGLGPAAEPALRAALDHADFRVRRAACELLGRLRSAAAAPRLAALLRDPDDGVREAALDAVERIGPPALEEVRKARAAGTLPPEAADAALDRPVKRAVESLLNGCISKDLGWGFYKDQFKDIVALGDPAVRVLLALFTTPEPDYVFTYVFDEEDNSARVRYRKQVVQRLAGEALVDMKSPSVIPALKSFLESLGDVDPLDDDDPRQDFHEAATFVLMKLGEVAYYEKLQGVFLKASGAQTDASGALAVALDADEKKRGRQFAALSRLAMLQIKADDFGAAERTYGKIIALASPPEAEAALRAFDLDRDGALDERESQVKDEALKRGFYPGSRPEDLRAMFVYRGILRNAHYNLACTLAQMQRKAEALDSLKKAVQAGYDDAEWIKKDGDLDAIKEEPEFKRLIHTLERRKLREEELRPEG